VGDKVVISATSPDLVEVQQAVFDKMAEEIKDIEGVTLTTGRVGHSDWNYVGEE
jgi:hypothetical protein